MCGQWAFKYSLKSVKLYLNFDSTIKLKKNKKRKQIKRKHLKLRSHTMKSLQTR